MEKIGRFQPVFACGSALTWRIARGGASFQATHGRVVPSRRVPRRGLPVAAQAGGATRNVNVTGPSLVSVTCMQAPNRPASTTGCRARAQDTT